MSLSSTGQIDNCEEALVSAEKFVTCADVKVPSPPVELAELFFNIVKRCTQHNYKKRCTMEEVYTCIYM